MQNAFCITGIFTIKCKYKNRKTALNERGEGYEGI